MGNQVFCGLICPFFTHLPYIAVYIPKTVCHQARAVPLVFSMGAVPYQWPGRSSDDSTEDLPPERSYSAVKVKDRNVGRRVAKASCFSHKERVGR